jgi:hypothetical protein
MKRLLFARSFASLALVLMFSGSLFAQTQASLEILPLHGTKDSVRLIAKMKNIGAAGFIMEAVYVTMTYENAKLNVDARSIMNHRWAGQGWGMDSQVLFRALNPNNIDTLQYGESTPTIGNGVTIPKNAPLDLCTFTFFPKVHPDMGTFTVVGNVVSPAYTGYYITSSINSIPFMPALSLQNYHWVPVDFISFTAAQQGEAIALRWITGLEVNNYGFFIERRYMELGNDEWKQIKFVKGRGNSNVDVTYIHFDSDLDGPGKYEYRLRQQDYDGTDKYSQVREVKYVLGAASFELQQNYPNPVSVSSPQGTMFRFTIAERSQVRMAILNTLGQVVAELTDTSYPAGNFSQSWMPSNLPPGMYIATLTSQSMESGQTQSATVRVQLVN